MPFDPNADTSDVGQMYRQFLQSKGMPITQENLQRVIAQSQREPGMIAGLSVQQAPTTPSAPTPPNLAGASPSSSGAPLPTPPIPPNALPPNAMPGLEAGMRSPPPVQAPSMAPQVSGPGSPPMQAPPQVGGPQMDIGGNDIAIPATPPPGQAPAPQQSTQPAPPPSSIADMILSGLTGLGVLGGGAAALRGGRGGQVNAPTPNTPPPPREMFAPGAASNQRPSGINPVQGPPAPPMQGPPPPPPGQNTATSVIENILKPQAAPPIPERPTNEVVEALRGVRPVGPPIQGPPMGPPPMQGPPLPPEVTATSPIENILKPQPPRGPVEANSSSWTGRSAPRVRARGVRVP